MEKLMTTAEVAEVIGVCTRTVANMSARGHIKRVELSKRCIRYRRSDILATFAAHLKLDGRLVGDK